MIWIGGSLAVNVESFGDAFRKSAKELDDTKLEDANPDDLLRSGIKCQKYSILGDHLVKTYAEVFEPLGVLVVLRRSTYFLNIRTGSTHGWGSTMEKSCRTECRSV